MQRGYAAAAKEEAFTLATNKHDGAFKNEARSNFFEILPYLPLGGLICALLIFMDGTDLPLFTLSNDTSSLLFLVSGSAAIVVFSLFFAIRGALSGPKSTTPIGYLRFGGLLAGATFCTLFFLSGTAGGGGEEGFASILPMICGILCGFGITASSLAWCLTLVSLSERLVLTVLSASCLVGGALKGAILLLCMNEGFLSGSVSSVVFGVAMFAFFAVSSKVPRAAAASGELFRGTLQSNAESTSEKEAVIEIAGFESQDESLLDCTRGMLSRNWMLFCGWLLCITVSAGIWSNELIVNTVGDGAVSDTSSSIFGFLLGALILFFIARFCRSETIRISYSILPVISVAGLILVWFLRSWNDAGGLFSFAPLGFSTAVCVCLLITRLSKEAGSRLSPYFVFGLSIAVAAVVFLAWFGIWAQLGFNVASIIDLAFKVIYLVAISVWMIVLSQRQTPTVVVQEQDRTLSDICESVSERLALSKRESEILYYLIQGRSSAYIAEQQFVSVNTIKTHIKRIYEKANVHSKQELLDVVHESSSMHSEDKPSESCKVTRSKK